MKNLYTPPPSSLENEFVEALYEKGNVRIEHIVSDGHSSPEGFWYDQSRNEWVCVLKGRARITFEDGDKELGEGDHMLIPAGKRHRVACTSRQCHWLAVFA